MDTIRVNPHHISDFPNGIARNGAMAIIINNHDPTGIDPDFIGQIYIDTQHDYVFIAAGLTSTLWRRVDNP